MQQYHNITLQERKVIHIKSDKDDAVIMILEIYKKIIIILGFAIIRIFFIFD